MTQADSSLAGRETTDWPGHRRQRSWVLHAPGREPDSGRREPSAGSCSRPGRVCGAPGVGGGASGAWNEPEPAVEGEAACPACSAGTRCYSCLPAGTVTPLRHLVGTSQVCGALFLLFPSEPQACGSPEGGRPSVEGEEGTMPGPLRAAMSNSRRWLTSSGGGVAGRDGGRHTRGLRGEGRP